jgi:cell wall assembly regulator SMI1/predicted DNA-binding WGR domain protein
MVRFELSAEEDDEEDAFWEITLDEERITTREGTAGSDGQGRTWVEADAAGAIREHGRLVKEKLAAGYRLRVPPRRRDRDDARTADDAPRVGAAIGRIEAWMREYAPLLATNLSDGASAVRLDAVEARLGFALPRDLRELWSIHDGQRSEGHGLFSSLDFLGSDRALARSKRTLMFVGFLRASTREWDAARATAAEVTSDEWIAIAARDSSSTVVSCVTGRVFACGKDTPPLLLVAESVGEWLEHYATALEDGRYELTLGFGGYYLELGE